MASIFKRGGRKAPRDAPWYIAYSVRPGLRRTVKGCADYEATRALARKLEADAMLRRKGVVDERAEQWAAAEARPLAEHVADFAAALRAKGNTQKHVKGTEKLVKRVAELAKATKLSDLTPSRVQGALADLRATRLSLSRCNHALRAVKSFCRWLAADGRTPGNALAHLRGFNVKTDRRRVRRSLTDGELARLIRAARTGPDLMGASGSDRAALYCVALGTGFRANELRSLTRQSFALDADPPTITVEAGYSKRRRRDCQPIPPALAEASARGSQTRRPASRCSRCPTRRPRCCGRTCTRPARSGLQRRRRQRSGRSASGATSWPTATRRDGCPTSIR